MRPIYDATRHFQVRHQDNSGLILTVRTHRHGMDGTFPRVLAHNFPSELGSQLLLRAGNGVLGVINQNHLNSFIDEQKVPI
jgi:hypothetical protein